MSINVTIFDQGGGTVLVAYDSTAETGLHSGGGFCNISWPGGTVSLSGPSNNGTFYVGYSAPVTASAGITYYKNTTNAYDHDEAAYATATTGPAPYIPPPAPPGTPALNGFISSDGSVTLSWSSVNPSGYTLLRDGQAWQTLSSGVLSYTDTIPPGVAHSYAVQGYNSGSGGTSYGGLSNTVTLSVPYAPTLTTPATGSAISPGVVQRFAWTAAFPSVGDTQSAFDVRYRLTGSTTWVSPLHGNTPNAFVDVPAGTFAVGNYEWQARTYNAQGVVGPWSTSSFFLAATPPDGPVITAPINNQVIGVSAFTVAWSTPLQDAYQVRSVADANGVADPSVVYYDSTPATDPVMRSLSVAFPTNGRVEHVQVRVRSNTLWSPWADVRVSVSYTQPAAPNVRLAVSVEDGSMTVTPSQPTPVGSQPLVLSIDVFRSEGGGPLERVAAGVSPTAPFIYWGPASDVPYAFMVRAYGTNGTTSESATVSTVAPTSSTGLVRGFSGGLNSAI